VRVPDFNKGDQKPAPPPVVYSNVFVPSENVEFGVISDIDDTVVPTGATRQLEMLNTTFLGNVQTRVPFPGVAAFDQALSKGLVGHENNPFFYVSSSPWNLYDFLRELMHIHHLPQGPLILITDTIESAHHAVSKGWILEEDIAHIAQEKNRDEGMNVSVL
jgi:phosphatidate phosphatase APP1